jgi:hypothetical protein
MIFFLPKLAWGLELEGLVRIPASQAAVGLTASKLSSHSYRTSSDTTIAMTDPQTKITNTSCDRKNFACLVRRSGERREVLSPQLGWKLIQGKSLSP